VADSIFDVLCYFIELVLIFVCATCGISVTQRSTEKIRSFTKKKFWVVLLRDICYTEEHGEDTESHKEKVLVKTGRIKVSK